MYKQSKTHLNEAITAVVDSGFQGIQHLHNKTALPVKKSKHNPLSHSQKRHNRELAQKRVLNEHVIGKIKVFKIIADRYRNRRKRFRLRFNLIAGIYNLNLVS